MKPTVVSMSPITLAELREGIDRIKKRDNEPSIRVKKTDEYLEAFSGLNQKKSAELLDKLMKLSVPRLREPHICKIVDLLPVDVNDLKLILQGYTITVSNDNLKKIVDLVKEYV